ncbi:TRAP transporter substrate-binding protein DctP [Marinobacter sp. M3C]|jgi:TRAP-type mannitol/chloroaromatic compound transport system substrate-binding protein|uniref:TRAP transporter substrate-binding protein DctP n=1 Tax=unclassified Marinobacter TaxID=83889 RepID=UPI00200F4BAE|nr:MULTISPECIES: TRAP transporter substrate-binding protein DctP [unclassified Marinobacter]UQG56472.1 TRAP transporter substrate-binding protein DctP [Marinobacter sp. M4C]UQG62334.1 TRAP transporter substrate-binding protein DctP [Marinobacter sp. M3C]UQG65276.1 TRAP transporter substrate-binding protein DctP [Marinobacter sp. M2C]UQG69555.1 TRAP transporter substrate-binding protein DctP [Marinobacter sp. M1C]
MTDNNHKIENEGAVHRRGFLKTLAVSAAISATLLASSVQAATTWKIQSVWDAGTVGYDLFKGWCDGMEEKSGGELKFTCFPAKAVAADNNGLFDAVRNGVLQGMNPFTIYWSGKIPASVFMTSYPGGPDQPHQWDTMFYALGMLEKTREIYEKFGLFYVGPIQHDANIIHSKEPVNSLEDLKGLKMRLPGGMVAEVFAEFGVSSVSLPGSDIFPALEKGTIDAADYVGPAVNWELGFAQVTDNILMGPPGVMSVYQPVDLMDLTINLRAWNALDPKLQQLVEDEVRIYSQKHYLAIQARNIEAMKKFKEAGTTVSRLSQEDLQKFRRAAIPAWFRWANKDEDARAIFDIQLAYMMNDIVGYVSEDDIKGLK